MKDTCGVCGNWLGLHEAGTGHCPVDASESGLFMESVYQAEKSDRVAELEKLLADAETIIDEKNKAIMDLKLNKGIDEMIDRIAELESALGDAIHEIKMQYAQRFRDYGDFAELGEKNETIINLRTLLKSE